MSSENWKLSETLHCQQLTAEYLEQALDLFATVFLPNENVCRSVKISEDAEAVKELRQLAEAMAKDGISIIAVDITNNKVVGVAFNKLQIKGRNDLEDIAAKWTNPSSLGLVGFICEFDNLCNLFDHCQVNCLVELEFLITSLEYKGQGIGKKLTELTIEVATNLKNGLNVRIPVDDSELKLDYRPGIVCSIFTTFITQKIGRQIGFQVAAEKSCSELQYPGMDVQSILESGTSKITLEFIKL